MIENPRSFNSAVNLAFLQKKNTVVALNADIEFKDFILDPLMKYACFQQLMCPVRALLIYRDCMREVRGQNRALFVHFNVDQTV